MKSVLRGLLIVSLLIGTPNALLAQNNSDAKDRSTTDTATRREAFSARLEEARKQFSSDITKEREERIARACNAAQTKITDVLNRTKEFQQNHLAIYQRWLDKLTTLSSRLDTAGVDTTTLDGYLQELNALIAQSTTDLENYIASLETVSLIDCTTDSKAFYESLQVARAARSLVVNDTKEIVAFVNNKIKPELAKIRRQLQDSANSDQLSATDQNRQGGTQ